MKKRNRSPVVPYIVFYGKMALTIVSLDEILNSFKVVCFSTACKVKLGIAGLFVWKLLTDKDTIVLTLITNCYIQFFSFKL